MPPENPNWGGKREGSGRKSSGQPRKPSLSITGEKEELERLREKAEQNNKTVSRFVLESLECTNEQNQ